jgi:hypothetical protein
MDKIKSKEELLKAVSNKFSKLQRKPTRQITPEGFSKLKERINNSIKKESK